MQTYTITHHLDGHEVATYEPRKNHDALVVKAPDGLHSATISLPHSTPVPLRLAFLRSLAHAAEELAEQIELIEGGFVAVPNRGVALADQHIAEAKVAAGIALATTDSEYDR